MCGIFGVIIKKEAAYSTSKIDEILKKIALYSESRGKDSSGLAVMNFPGSKVDVTKGDIRVKHLLTQHQTKTAVKNALDDYKQKGDPFCAFGHARLVTNGSQLNYFNNQPVIKSNVILIHNGIIINNEEVWKQRPEFTREYEIDTEIINELVAEAYLNRSNLAESLRKELSLLEGTFSIASLNVKTHDMLLATNNGSLYYLSDFENYIIFCSEKFYLDKLIKSGILRDFDKEAHPRQLLPNSALNLNIDTFRFDEISLSDSTQTITNNNDELPVSDFVIVEHAVKNKVHKKEVVIDPSIYINRDKEADLFNLLEFNEARIKAIRRCSKCILPATFPFITFDNEGVCNYCKNYKVKQYPDTIETLKELVKPYRSKDGGYDCIVPFSGGRDSTYSLHLIKKELGLNPITLTYDWGMVTDLARRNIAKVCGKLGVENIIVSADINWKRDNIHKNINAWLKNPNLGMIPLFMAGDKYFFYYTDRLKKQTGIDLNIWGINHLENTDFKIGFAGVRPNFDKKTIYSISLKNQIDLFRFVGSNFLKSPGYLNASLLDTLGSFVVRYLSPKKDYYHLFDYYKWDENEINSLLENEYGWEKAIDTDSTWRIGDGTASFYNYIYFTVAGFSEFDTFRSNQIREGAITRDEALDKIYKENFPRYETLRWYLEIVGIDFAKAINIVNKIPKLY